MTAEVQLDLVQVYKGATPPDLTSTQYGEDIAAVIASVMAVAEAEVSRLALGVRLASATGLFLTEHAEDHGLRPQDGENDEQQRARYRNPPKAITPKNILDAVKAIVGGVRASLDLAPLTTNCETVIEAVDSGDEGNSIRIRFVADGIGDGELEENGTNLTFHFEDGVTSVLDFEIAIDASVSVRVKTSDGVGTLASPDDTFGYTSLAGGVDAPCFMIELPLDSWYYDRDNFLDVNAWIGGARGVVIVLIPQSAGALSSVKDAVRSKISAGKLYFVLEYI